MEQLNRLTCPVCGGQLESIGAKQFKCQYCKGVFELKEELTNDDIINLNRAETERRRFLFDDALDSYEQVLEKHPDNEMALWGAFLCEYGVEYVEDYDSTFKPTCHRASEKPVSSSSYYKRLPESYKQKALAIEEIRKEIISQMKGLDKYDVFICYKSKLDGGRTSTIEARLGYNIYNELYRERPKLKVFFADETLSLHNANYEPQIFNALKTAKLMIVIGTTLENVKAPWVKNEWKRFYEMSKKDKSKVIRVVYQDIEPYDFPRELQGAQMIDNYSGKMLSQVLLAVDEIFKVAEPIQSVDSISKVIQQQIKPQPKPVATTPVKKPTTVAQSTVPEKPQPKPAAPKPSVNVEPRAKVVIQNVVYELKGKEYHVVQSPDATGEIVIQDSIDGLPITVVEEKAFIGTNSITKVTIGKNVTGIGNYAFSFLTRVDYTGDINSWAMISFGNSTANPLYYAKHLYIKGEEVTEVVLDTATKVNAYAFYNATSITKVTIGNQVKSIGSSAFYNCTALTEIKFNATAMNNLSSSNCVFSNERQSGKGIKVTIGKNVTKIPANLFTNSTYSYSPKITSVVFEEGSVCKKIGEHAFSGCHSLTSVIMGKRIISIDHGAFSGCALLTSITIPNSVTSIARWEFSGCSSLSNVIFEETEGWVHGNKKLSSKLFRNQKKLIKFLTKKQEETMQRS